MVDGNRMDAGEHTVLQPGGELQNVGGLAAGSYRFSAGVAQRVEVSAGRCRVKLADTQEWAEYGPGESFHVPGGTHYDLEVSEGFEFATHHDDPEPGCEV